MFIVAASLVLTALLVYWVYGGVWTSGRYIAWPLVLLPLIVIALIYVRIDDPKSGRDGAPVLIAIAADVSLSMGTLPDPRAQENVGTRLARARGALLPLLRELDSSTRPVMIAVTAFTSKSETILAWDDELPQIREAIEYVLATGLLTEPGSDLGAALEGVARLFESLPEAYSGADYPKFLILVSDGEQNVDKADAAAALAALRETGVRIISLHVGMSGIPEGLPVYDEGGAFIGFDDVGGQMFSVPDPDLMTILAGSDPAKGTFVKAEHEDAAEAMLDFLGVQIAGPGSGPVRTGLLLSLWCLVLAVTLRYV